MFTPSSVYTGQAEEGEQHVAFEGYNSQSQKKTPATEKNHILPPYLFSTIDLLILMQRYDKTMEALTKPCGCSVNQEKKIIRIKQL